DVASAARRRIQGADPIEYRRHHEYRRTLGWCRDRRDVSEGICRGHALDASRYRGDSLDGRQQGVDCQRAVGNCRAVTDRVREEFRDEIVNRRAGRETRAESTERKPYTSKPRARGSYDPWQSV